MKRLIGPVLAAALLLALAAPSFAAPLFPDVPDTHWAKDAVAALAAKGLVEGYPDGTFKGDRAASRWEVAMVVARLLARMEQEHATFATKAELEEVRKLVSALREELDALGVRVTNLEENVGRIDQRVAELERITFYGEVRTRLAAQGFTNDGSPAMRGATGAITIDYNNVTGTAAGAGGVLPNGLPFNPFVFGVLTNTNWRTGRPLTTGTGFTMVGELGVRTRLTDDLDAGVEFFAFTTQGDNLVDTYYGETAPYLSNVFTGQVSTGVGGAAAGVQPQNHAPFTRMNLDHFWIQHNPSKTRLVLGAFGEEALDFDDGIYVPEVNPGAWAYYSEKVLEEAEATPADRPGPYPGQRLDSFGILASGETYLDSEETLLLKWQAMGTRLADGSVDLLGNVAGAATGNGYFSHAEGATVGILFHEERGEARINFLHAANEASGGAALTVGLIQSGGPPHGHWVNPNGFYINQLGGQGDPRVGGINSTSDRRPVVTTALPIPTPTQFDGNPASVLGPVLGAGTPAFGGIGPQDQTSYGLSFEYEFDSPYRPWIEAQWAHTDYRPQKNSSYSTSGDAFEVEVGARFLDDTLEAEVAYLSVDPRFDPFILSFPTVGGISTVLWRTPDFHYFNNLYSLHDTRDFPHNREGVRARVTWKFNPFGLVKLEYGNLQQKETSLQDVRFSHGSIRGGPGAPAAVAVPFGNVLGYSPGFIDPVFGPFDPNTFFNDGSGNALAGVRENPRGRVTNWGLSVGHKWILDEETDPPIGVTLKGGFKFYNFFRQSNMTALGTNPPAGVPALARPLALAAENRNHVDLDFFGWHLEAGYDVTPDFEIYAGYTNVDIRGHLDPNGTMGPFIALNGDPRRDVVDINQTWPEVGFDWDVGENTTFGMNARFFRMEDNIPATVFPSPSVPTLNTNLGFQTGAHPYNWSGYQVVSSFSVKF